MTRLWLGEGLKATYLRTDDKHNFVFARVFLVASDRKLKVLAHLIELFLPYLLKISQGIMDFKYGSIKTLIIFTLPSALYHVKMVSPRGAKSWKNPQFHMYPTKSIR